ncbi:hypothetical protein QF004_002576 [Chryseobacterium sp. MDT2-18]|nr:hypothetical protein [Chryseobacterium sp. MDT2-18]
MRTINNIKTLRNNNLTIKELRKIKRTLWNILLIFV